MFCFLKGGDTYHLMRWLNKTRLTKILPELLKNKVYVGVSAGSMVTNPDLNLKLSRQIYEEDMLETEEMKGLDFVDFYFLPHLNSEWFKKVRRENIEKIGLKTNKPIYALDDQSALKIIDNKIEIISEGSWFVVNEKQ